MLIKKKYYLLVLLLVMLNVSTYFYLNKTDQITAPDLIQNNFFSDVFAKTYSLETCEFSFWLDPIFWTRWLRITKDNCVSHWSMDGFIIFLWIFKAISINLQNLAIPLCVFIFLVYLYKTSFFLLKKKNVSLLIIFLSFFFPSIFLHSNLLFNNIPEVAFFFWFLFYSLQYHKEHRIKYLALWMIFLSISFWMRYIVIIFSIPILLLYMKNFKYKSLFYGLSIIIIFMTPFLVTNLRLFGNVMGTPKANLASVQYYNLNVAWVCWWIWVKYFFNKQVPIFFLKNLYDHFISLYPYIFLFLCLLILSTLLRKKRVSIDKLAIISVVGLVFLFYYIWVWGGFGDRNTLATSYARYTILWYALLLIFVIDYIAKMFKNRPVFIILIFLIVLNFLMFSLKSTNWYLDVDKSYAKALERKESLLSGTEQNGIIFTSYYDKLFFPDRIGAIYTSYPENTRISNTTTIVLKLLKLWYPVYFIESDWWVNYDKFKFEDYKKSLLKSGTIVESIHPPIYQIKLQPHE